MREWRYRRRIGMGAARLVRMELVSALVILNLAQRAGISDRPEFGRWRLDRSLIRDRFDDLGWVLTAEELTKVASAFQDADLLNERFSQFVEERLMGATSRDADLQEWVGILEDARIVLDGVIWGGSFPWYLLTEERRRARKNGKEVIKNTRRGDG